jgi:hypothetical protein
MAFIILIKALRRDFLTQKGRDQGGKIRPMDTYMDTNEKEATASNL